MGYYWTFVQDNFRLLMLPGCYFYVYDFFGLHTPPTNGSGSPPKLARVTSEVLALKEISELWPNDLKYMS